MFHLSEYTIAFGPSAIGSCAQVRANHAWLPGPVPSTEIAGRVDPLGRGCGWVGTALTFSEYLLVRH